MVKPYTDYKRIEGVADQNNFSQGVRWLLDQAKTGFASVKGEKLDNSAMFNQYKVTFMPTGREDCYLEDRGMSVTFVHADRPYNVAGTLYVEKILDGYNMNLSLKAEPKPVM